MTKEMTYLLPTYLPIYLATLIIIVTIENLDQ